MKYLRIEDYEVFIKKDFIYTLNGDKCEKYNEKKAKAHYNK